MEILMLGDAQAKVVVALLKLAQHERDERVEVRDIATLRELDGLLNLEDPLRGRSHREGGRRSSGAR